ncbi:MAG: hypothetical protein IJ539_01220 [Prevotella sp.]|nr:hypothetical protein [Prevotella sp.]
MNERLHLALCECAAIIARHTSQEYRFRVTTGDITAKTVDVRIEFMHDYHGTILRTLSTAVDTSMPTSLRQSIFRGFEKLIEQYVSEHQTR